MNSFSFKTSALNDQAKKTNTSAKPPEKKSNIKTKISIPEYKYHLHGPKEDDEVGENTSYVLVIDSEYSTISQSYDRRYHFHLNKEEIATYKKMRTVYEEDNLLKFLSQLQLMRHKELLYLENDGVFKSKFSAHNIKLSKRISPAKVASMISEITLSPKERALCIFKSIKAETGIDQRPPNNRAVPAILSNEEINEKINSKLALFDKYQARIKNNFSAKEESGITQPTESKDAVVRKLLAEAKELHSNLVKWKEAEENKAAQTIESLAGSISFYYPDSILAPHKVVNDNTSVLYNSSQSQPEEEKNESSLSSSDSKDDANDRPLKKPKIEMPSGSHQANSSSSSMSQPSSTLLVTSELSKAPQNKSANSSQRVTRSKTAIQRSNSQQSTTVSSSLSASAGHSGIGTASKSHSTSLGNSMDESTEESTTTTNSKKRKGR